MNLQELLQEGGVKCAHIIDDAFDEVPALTLREEEVQGLLDALTDTDFDAIAQQLELPDSTEEQIRLALLNLESYQLLYRKREEMPQSCGVLFSAFTTAQNAKLAQVLPLIELLEASGVVCHKFGAAYNAAGSSVPQLFFVDLRLNESTALVSHEDAVKVYQKLTAVHAGCKPFVFLMSSLSTPLAARREDFRRSADLFQSEFEDIDKKIFEDKDELVRVLGRYAKVMPQLSQLRGHMESIQSAVGKATTSVMQELRALDLADYFVLYHNTTSVEKVQLGSYVVELLLEFLAHEVEGTEQLWGLAKALSDLDVTTLPRSRFGLSFAAAKIYSASMLHAGKRLLAEEAAGAGPAQGFFYLGDVFFEAKEYNEAAPTRALAIITPACDLVRPEDLEGKSVLLCEGSVQTVSPGTIPSGTDFLPSVVMQHPKDDKKQLLIDWSKKKLHVWGDAERTAFTDNEKCHYVRVSRLRPIYAIQLQHAVTADLGRIGTQRPPSLLLPHGLQCFISDGQNWIELDSEDAQHPTVAALSDGKRKGKKHTLFVVADPVVQRVLRKLKAWLVSNQAAATQTILTQILKYPEIEQKLMYFDQKVPEKAAKGEQQLDITAYPLQGTPDFPGNQGKVVAVVRPKSSSPYVDIVDGRAVNAQHIAKMVLRLVDVGV